MRVRALFLPLLLSAAAPLCVHAQDMTPMTDRILSDPAFLPLKGEFYGQSTYAYVENNGDRYNSTGAQSADTRNVANNLTQYFAYGITDDISINASLSGDVSGYHRTDNAVGDTRINASGFYDPTFGLTWRAVDQRAGAFNLDLFGVYSPDVFSNNTGSPTQDASVARGGGEGDFGVAISRENRFFTIRADATGRYFGSSTLNDTMNGDTTRTTSYWAPALGVQSQVRFTPRMSANAGFTYTFNGNPRVYNDATGLQYINNIGDTQAVNVSLNYHFVPNRLVGSINYGHTFYNDNRSVYPGDPIFNAVDHRTEDTVGGTLRYVFK